MRGFRQAEIGFRDDDDPSAPRRLALLHHPDLTVEEARQALGDADWPVYAIDGHPGVWITPKGGIPAAEFAQVMTGLGDGWLLKPDPR